MVTVYCAEKVKTWKFILNINRKRRRAPVIEDSDSEEGGAQTSGGRNKRQTRKLKTEKESEEIMKTDPETKEQHGFSDEAIDIAQVRKMRVSTYKRLREITLSVAQERLDKLDKYLERDDDEISVSSVDSEELDAADGGDVIYLEKGAVPGDVVATLAERFPGRPPKLVPPMPDWLGALLAGWDLRRHEVAHT